MDSGWQTKLKNTLSELETALKDVSVEHEREIEVLNLRYKTRREALQQAVNSVAIALENGEEPKTIPKPIREDGESELSGVKSSATERPNGVISASDSSSNQNGIGTERFSVRREIEKLLSEFPADRDVIQGEIRLELEKRFPQYEDLLKAATVSSILRRLANAGDLVLVSKGSGSEPNRYRLTEQTSVNEDQEESSELRE